MCAIVQYYSTTEVLPHPALLLLFEPLLTSRWKGTVVEFLCDVSVVGGEQEYIYVYACVVTSILYTCDSTEFELISSMVHCITAVYKVYPVYVNYSRNDKNSIIPAKCN